MSIWHANYIRVQLPPPAPVEAWFAHAAPPRTAAYERTFAGTLLRFDAPCYGIAFAHELLDAPLFGADAELHAAQCQHLDFLQTRLSEPPSFSLQVRELIAAELRRGHPTSLAIARRLQLSRRTLVRRLHGEGTTFKRQLDKLRREVALNLIVRPEFKLTEISAYLRFSHIQAFHRAFRRWTGQTPAQFREQAQDAG